MTDFVTEINALDFTAVDTALGNARAAMEKARQLSLSQLNPTALLGDLGAAITAVNDAHLDTRQLSDLGRAALGELGQVVQLPDLNGLESMAGELEQVATRLSGLVEVFSGGGDGRAVLDRVLTTLTGSLDLDTFVGQVISQAEQVLRGTIPEDISRQLQALSALAGNPSAGQLTDVLGRVVVGIDVAGIGELVTSARSAVAAVAAAGDAGPLEAAVAAVRARLDTAYTLMAAPAVDVTALLAAVDEMGAAVSGVGSAATAFAAGLATDLRTAANTLAELGLPASLERLADALPLPGEDIPAQLVESLSAMADALEGLTEAAVTDALAAMRDDLLGVAGLDKLADLLSGMDEAFDDVGAQLDRLPLRALRDDAVAALVGAQQRVLAFDGLSFLDDAVAPIRDLEAKVAAVDTSAIAGAVQGLAGQVDALLADADLTPLRQAVEAVVEPLGEIVGRLVPFVRQVADQLAQLVNELRDIDFDAAGTATLDLLHGIRGQVTSAVGGGDVPEPVRAAVAAAAAVLREMDLAAQLTTPFDKAVVSIDVGALLQPIEQVWTLARETLHKATPEALVAELDPPFQQLLSAVGGLSLQPLVDAVQKLFDELVVTLGALDPRRLVAPLENQFQELVRSVEAALDPAPLFAPLREAYAALRGLVHQIDVSAMLHGVLGGLADMPHQISGGLEQRIGANGARGLPAPAPGDAFALGDVLRPLALFLGEVRARLAQLAPQTLGPVLAELASATRGLRALVDPATGVAAQLGDALDARLAWLDPQAGDGPLARLRADLESFRMAVLSLEVDAAAHARLSAAADGVQLQARVSLSFDPDLAERSAQVRANAGSAELGRGVRVVARALDAALPAELLTGNLDPLTATGAFLDAVFDRLDPAPLADRLDAIGERIQARFAALADEIGGGLLLLLDGLFAGVAPLMPDAVISRLQAGVDRVLGRLSVLDPAPIEDEVRSLVRAAVSLLAVHSPAAVAAELGGVFDACIERLRSLSPAALFAGLDPFAPLRAQLEELRPSLVLAPLTQRTAGFGTALDTVTSIDLSVVSGALDEVKATFATVLAGVQAEWNGLLEELAQISGGGSASAGVG